MSRMNTGSTRVAAKSMAITAASIVVAIVAGTAAEAAPPVPRRVEPTQKTDAARDAEQAAKAAEPANRRSAPLTTPMLVFTVDVKWLGATSFKMEHNVTSRIEQALKTLPGVLQIRSTTIGSRAQTQVSFAARTDPSSTATAIRSRLDQIRARLPRDASHPLIAWHREPPA